MTRKFPSPAIVALVTLVISLFISPADAVGASKKPAKKPPAPAAKTSKTTVKDKKSRSAKGGEQASAKKDSARGRASAKETRADRRREERAAKNDRRASKNDRNERADKQDRRDDRRASKDDDRKAGGKASRKERLAEARREAERRRREEAERRAEIARQAAIARAAARAAAIARQRAADQALRDETVANIMRDDTTGEDPEVRRAAIEALGNHAGSVVVMSPKDGRVYAVVNQDWAVRKGFKPCSTVKIVTGLAGLSDHVIDPVQTVNIGTGSFRLDLTDSLAFSNNIYFQKVGGEVGFDRMMEYARKLGLGQPTGINHANESPGRLPLFKNGYAVNHMSSHGDDIEVTPVQLANMTSALANGGQLLIPHLPRTPEENVRFRREVKRDIGIPQENLRRIVPGMIGAVNYGTAKLAQDPTQTVAGKTGSCTGQGSWLGLFTSYAPVQDPQLVVSVVTRGSGERGRVAAGVAGRIYRSLNQRFGARPGTTPMLANDMLPTRPKIDPSKAKLVSDEDAEADAYVVSEAEDTSATQNNAVQSNVQKTSKSIQRPSDSSPRPSPSTSQPVAPEQRMSPQIERPRRVFDRP
ncbi:MAG TPA: penicillin-binding transpeptidase domain-containing protein [Pyrinomonadaceae bacterium]|nr:penicillin-binding transpeptidase domain-containing protein [Pyrinomonadaceae bacterium]